VYEREFRDMMILKGYHCERVAGSGSGHDAVCDCVLFTNGKTYLVEVKAVKDKIFYMRAEVKKQLGLMIEVCSKHGLIPLIAIKFKNRGWNIHNLEVMENIEYRDGVGFEVLL